MSEHTPGPWEAKKTEDEYIVCELTAGWCVVATKADPNKYNPEADARLIAAAPNLLKAAEKVSAFELNEINGDVVDESAHDLARTRAVESLIHIVAKAKGEHY